MPRKRGLQNRIVVFSLNFVCPRVLWYLRKVCVKFFGCPYQAGILGSCSEGLSLLAFLCHRLLGTQTIFRTVWPSTGGFSLGSLSKPVYPTSSNWLSFRWNAMVESSSLSVLLCSLSPLGPAVTLIHEPFGSKSTDFAELLGGLGSQWILVRWAL